jgi:hypothetical protein
MRVSRWLRFITVLCGLLWGLAGAQLLGGKGAQSELRTVVTPHFRVLHPPRLEVFARQVAAAAEFIRAEVIATVGNDPGLTDVLVGDETDDFNGYALPGPYPFVRVYATFPDPTDIGAQWQDVMVALVGHEFTHVAHLSTRDDLRNTLRGVFGPVPGLLEARVPPAWFVEGYAVYLESKLTTGGRVRDSLTRTLRRAIAIKGRFPSLSDAGIGTLERYPFGNTRYVFGAGFVDFLVQRYGEAGLRAVIARYNGTITFEAAWQGVHGVSLEALWAQWAALETAAARDDLERLGKSGLEAGTVLHAGSGAPAWRDATHYAFMQGNALRTARLVNGRAILEPRFTVLPSRPQRLSYLPDGSLVYSRLRADGATTYGEVYRFEDGVETRLTTGARARDAIADGACIVWVRDVLEREPRVTLERRCGETTATVWTAPSGWHVFQPSVNPAGEIALAVWRPGGYLDIGVLRGDRLELLTSDAAQDQFPVWLSDGSIAFSSDRDGIAQVWTVKPGERTVQPVTSSIGGAYNINVSPSGALTFAAYTATGLETRVLEAPKPGESRALRFSDPPALPGLDGLEYAVEPYTPNLAPLFWTPVTATGVGATVYGADAAGLHNYQFGAGLEVLSGAFTANAAYRYTPRPDLSLNLGAALNTRSGWSIGASAVWDGRAESQTTGRFRYTVAPSVTLEASGLTLAFGLRLDAMVEDVFGYAERGWILTTRLDSRGAFSSGVTLADSVSGLPVVLTLRAGFTQKDGVQLTSRLETRVSVPIHWRYVDGFVGLERVSFTPFATLETAGYSVGLGVLADLTFNYYAPVSVGAELAWTGNAWRVRLVSLIPLLENLR